MIKMKFVNMLGKEMQEEMIQEYGRLYEMEYGEKVEQEMIEDLLASKVEDVVDLMQEIANGLDLNENYNLKFGI